jgi:hypothetical protein
MHYLCRRRASGAFSFWGSIGWRSGQMNPKLTMLFLLIGSIICLSHLSREIVFKLKCKLDTGRWRKIVPKWRKS